MSKTKSYTSSKKHIFNRSLSSSNKENRPNNAAPMNGNTFATPSEDDFDDDDDELLIAASQQVEKKMAQEKVKGHLQMLTTNCSKSPKIIQQTLQRVANCCSIFL
jgi:hypothetical protein